MSLKYDLNKLNNKKIADFGVPLLYAGALLLT